ncbi:hypothetical protein TEA_008551 [Camellia sinensis var. sinensis]|uniref:ABC transporter domain-containing protein n=1 Tax=Camellia sinensis var. sinensis TaxID=542762 RepID=A0A4V3WQE3_CAMSN|nr:hypothetical protein TEA_008551 [Camellia sinensis var. sinensis]
MESSGDNRIAQRDIHRNNTIQEEEEEEDQEGLKDRKDLLSTMIRDADDHHQFLQMLKGRMDRVSLDLPTIEVRFENLNVDAEAYVGSRGLPTIINSFLNVIEVSGKVTYNGHEMHEFVPQRTSSYVSQSDEHIAQMTVRETLAFSARCQGIGTPYDMVMELLRREKELNIEPDLDIDILLKAAGSKEHKDNLVTDYILKILGLEDCADTIVGNEIVRGISGGQRRRVTIGEMLVGPARSFFMDNISTGLDSVTTFRIINSIRQSVHILKKTVMISLLQPALETYNLFDDIILISEGQIVYHGPCECVLDFFESMGFKCPGRKVVADYLQEVTSREDQKQYWVNEDTPYRYISVNEFAEAFQSFHIGKAIRHELLTPFDRSKCHPAALVRSKYATNRFELLSACLSRECILMKRNSFLYMFKIFQHLILAIISATLFGQSRVHHQTIEDGLVHLGALYCGLIATLFTGFFELPMTIEKLPVFYKQRGSFYPSWAYSLPTSIVKTPVSIIEVAIWVMVTYYAIGFDPTVERPVLKKTHYLKMFRQFLILALSGQMSYGIFRCIAALSRDHNVANTGGNIAMVWLVVFSGFALSRHDMKKWLIWGYWTTPLMYVQTALSINEFLGGDWKYVFNKSTEALGISVLKSRGIFTTTYWYWIGIDAVIGFIFLFGGIYTLALTYLNRFMLGIVFRGLGSRRYSEQDVLNGVGSMYTTIMFLATNACVSVLPVITADRVVFYRERAAEAYSAFPYAIAQVAIEIPYTLAQTLVYGIIVYAMIGFELSSTKFFLYLFFFFFTFLYCTYFGMMVVAISPNQEISATLCSANFTLWNVFSGFLIPPAVFGREPENDGCGSGGGGRDCEVVVVAATKSDSGIIIGGGGGGRGVETFSAHFRAGGDGFNVQFDDSMQRIPTWWKWYAWVCPFSWSLYGLACSQYGDIQSMLNNGETVAEFITRYSEQDVLNGVGSMYTTIMFLATNACVSVLPVITADRVVFYRERAAEAYSAFPYAIAQVAIEIPYTLAQTLVYGIIVYAMIGFELSSTKFFLYLFFFFFTFLYCTYFGMMVVAISPNQEISATLCSANFTLWNLFSGFLIPPAYGDIQSMLNNGETVAEFITRYFGYKNNFLKIISIGTIGFAVIFACIFAVSISTLNFQKR